MRSGDTDAFFILFHNSQYGSNTLFIVSFTGIVHQQVFSWRYSGTGIGKGFHISLL
jgi:hypothetical protein